MASEEALLSLLDLPDPCLLAVLQCCTNDQRSLFSAARAHSRLHQAAVVALRSITAAIVRDEPETGQQLVDSLMVYLQHHGQHVDSISLDNVADDAVILRQLPPALQLTSIVLDCMGLQLQPGNDSQGMQGIFKSPVLKQLRLIACSVHDDAGLQALAATQLPTGLEHLSLSFLRFGEDSEYECDSMDNVVMFDVVDGAVVFYPAVRGDAGDGDDGSDNDSGSGSDSGIATASGDGGVDSAEDTLPYVTGLLRQVQQLTSLELFVDDCAAVSPVARSPFLQPLQALTRLKVLCLRVDAVFPASLFSGMQHLTRLHVEGGSYDPDMLAGKTQLQHLSNPFCSICGAAETARLLSHLQHLQGLTYLHLDGEERGFTEEPHAPAASYSALTASSKLQELVLIDDIVPAGAWQHIFPAGRQLPHLQSLDISKAVRPVGGYASTPEGSRLVSCCPGLQRLAMVDLRSSADYLAALQGLSELHTLHFSHSNQVQGVLEAVCQLTGLQELQVEFSNTPVAQELLQLTALQQLTKLRYITQRTDKEVTLSCMGAGDEPVWRQLQRLLINPNARAHGAAQKAAAPLAQ